MAFCIVLCPAPLHHYTSRAAEASRLGLFFLFFQDSEIIKIVLNDAMRTQTRSLVACKSHLDFVKYSVSYNMVRIEIKVPLSHLGINLGRPEFLFIYLFCVLVRVTASHLSYSAITPDAFQTITELSILMLTQNS